LIRDSAHIVAEIWASHGLVVLVHPSVEVELMEECIGFSPIASEDSGFSPASLPVTGLVRLVRLPLPGG